MYKELLKKIEGRRGETGREMEPPASKETVARLESRAKEELGAGLPPAYLEFLGLHDGLIHNGLNIYGSEFREAAASPGAFIDGVIEETIEHRDIGDFDHLIVLGEASIDLYVYDTAAKRFEVRDLIARDETGVDFASFEELLAYALEAHL